MVKALAHPSSIVIAMGVVHAQQGVGCILKGVGFAQLKPTTPYGVVVLNKGQTRLMKASRSQGRKAMFNKEKVTSQKMKGWHFKEDLKQNKTKNLSFLMAKPQAKVHVDESIMFPLISIKPATQTINTKKMKKY